MSARSSLRLMVVLALCSLMLGCGFYRKLQARDDLNKGVRAFTAKKYDEAIEHFKAATEQDPELVDAKLYLAATYRAQFVPFVSTADNLRIGRTAIAKYEEVLAKDEANVNAILSIADLHRNLNEPEESKSWYRRYMEVSPDDRAMALYGIAVLDYNVADTRTGKDGDNVENLAEEDRAEVDRIVDEAIAALQEALEINPQYTEAMEYLNLLYREKGELTDDEDEKRRWDREAMQLAQQALALKRQQQREEEQARREVFKREGGN